MIINPLGHGDGSEAKLFKNRLRYGRRLTGFPQTGHRPCRNKITKLIAVRLLALSQQARRAIQKKLKNFYPKVLQPFKIVQQLV